MKRILPIALIVILLCACAAPTTLPAGTTQNETSFAALPVEKSPAPVASTVPPTAVPTVTPAPTATPEPQIYDAPQSSYTFAWISDPQHYAAKYPDTYYAITSFLSDNRERLNLQYTIVTGDLVNNYKSEEQWTVADGALQHLDGLPYGVLAGNHDIMRTADDAFTLYQKYCGEQRFQDLSCYGESYQNNLGHYDLIDVGNAKYIFVYMSVRMGDEGLAFTKAAFEKYPDRVGILCLHDYVDGKMALTQEGARFYRAIVSTADNLYLVLCGHRYGVNHTEETFQTADGGERRVVTMLQNYQAAAEGGRGYLSLLRINEASGELDILNYSPVTKDVDLFDTYEERTKNYPQNAVCESVTLPLPWQAS